MSFCTGSSLYLSTSVQLVSSLKLHARDVERARLLGRGGTPEMSHAST